MGYYANGGGDVTLQSEVPENVLELLSCAGFAVDKASDSGLWLTFEYNKFHEDDTEQALKRLAPYVKDGNVDFSGDDDEHWRYEFEDGKVYYAQGAIEYVRGLELGE